jgi:hypothetical protein
MTGMIIMRVRQGMEVPGQKMGMIILLFCGAVLGTTIRISAVPLTAATASAATTTTTSVFGWCAVPGGLCNPFSLFSLFTLILYFFSFPPLGGSIFSRKLGLMLNFMKAMKELSVIQKCYDLVKWYVPIIERFPRVHKFTIGDRVINQLYNILENLIRAKFAKSKLAKLEYINTELAVLRHQNRLLLDFKLIDLKRYRPLA